MIFKYLKRETKKAVVRIFATEISPFRRVPSEMELHANLDFSSLASVQKPQCGLIWKWGCKKRDSPRWYMLSHAVHSQFAIRPPRRHFIDDGCKEIRNEGDFPYIAHLLCQYGNLRVVLIRKFQCKKEMA